MSKTISLPIARPLAEVYEFLLEPRNYPRWAAALSGGLEHVEGRDWRAETPYGTVTMRFSERNAFGVFDHSVFGEGEEPMTRRARVVPNGDGCELLYTMFKRDEQSVEAFESEVEWTATELAVLKTYLELRDGGSGELGPVPVPPG
ncbi:MAG TPA: SRPBCC family protein [Devosiaceae bacterium]|nr:SRPBCC family protein [Devosiaceae bacterium]